jgi:hypothetical protein
MRCCERPEICSDRDGGECHNDIETVIASQRVGAMRRPMTGSAKQSSLLRKERSWIASSLRSSQ